MNYDLIIIGNGVMAQIFLYELKNVIKSKNFKIAHIFDETLAPACALKSTSTVSLNGIIEGISDLGDELYHAFYATQKFIFEFQKNHPPLSGITCTDQFVTATTDAKILQLKNRYKDHWGEMPCPLLKNQREGVQLSSFIFTPSLFFKALNKVKTSFNVDSFYDLALDIIEGEQDIQIKLRSGKKVIGNKAVIATGAYAKIFPDLLINTEAKIEETKIVAGSFLIKKWPATAPFYLTIDGHNVVYRPDSKELIIGSTTVPGPILFPDKKALKEIFETCTEELNFDVGPIESFNIVTGLRHKGKKRRPSFKPISSGKRIWLYSGAYKNGWSLPFYYIKRDLHHFY